MIAFSWNTKRALGVAFPCPACDKKQNFTWREEERKWEGRANSKALILTSNVHVKYKFCLSVSKTIEREGGGGREREGDRGRGEKGRGREREGEMEREREKRGGRGRRRGREWKGREGEEITKGIIIGAG